MGLRRVLVSWIGHTDLRAMVATLSAAKRKRYSPIIGSLRAPNGGLGPIKTLLDHEQFDEVHLLSNYPSWADKDYADWLGAEAIMIHPVGIENPTDYGEIFHSADAELRAITASRTKQAIELTILLSPGTPAMAAVWVLLGKSKYPARFFQTFENKAWETTIPFDLAVDLIPEVLRDADSAFHHLVSSSPQEVEGFERIVGNSRVIRLAVGRARKAALRDVPVLLLGESGTGKEMFARAMHASSRRKAGPFVPINCAAIPRELLESELFGHVKGAFTGAESSRDGAFKMADGGILFLDEIGECDPAIQAKLLRVLQPLPGLSPCLHEFRPVGAVKDIRSDVRIIAATNRKLLEAVDQGRFREDLYYRLAAISITLPPLRDRKTDISAIAAAILDQINHDFEAQEPGYKYKLISESANVFVREYDWPGNVRELANVLLQAAVMAEGDKLNRSDLQAAVSELPRQADRKDVLGVPIGDGFSLEKHLESIQSLFLKRAMREAGGVKSKAARLLGYKNYQTLDAQLKRLNVKWEGKP